MRRVAVTFGMIAAVALANPAGAALPLPHNFFDEQTPGPTPSAPNMAGNLPNGFGAFGGQITPFAAPVFSDFQSSNLENGFPLGGNGIPLFNVRFDPGHDFYNTLTAEVAPPSVPESSTWMMLLVGFAAIGFITRRNFRTFREKEIA